MNKAFIKRILRKIFEVGQKLGVDILPRYFYEKAVFDGLRGGYRHNVAQDFIDTLSVTR